MDFDDLDAAAANFGPSPAARRAELLASARLEPLRPKEPATRGFGHEGQLKILWMHGGGTNDRCSQAQFQNVFQHAGALNITAAKWRDYLEPVYFNGPHPVPREWHRAAEMQETMKAYLPHFWVYYDFDPPIERGGITHPHENWVGFEETMERLAAFLKENGPFDGLGGFDMGGCIAVQAAKRACEGDAAFAGLFRFIITFTAVVPKETSPLAGLRPKAPLAMPAFICFSPGDFAHPYPLMEEVGLFFPEELREVARHSDGHIPPRLNPELSATGRLVQFLNCMRLGLPWKPEACEENKAMEGLVLPFSRAPAWTAPAPEPGARRVLLVIHEPDLGARARQDLKDVVSLGAGPSATPLAAPPKPYEASVPAAQKPCLHDRCALHAAVAALAAEDFRRAAEAAEGYDASGFEILGAEFSEEHAAIEWGTPRELLPTSYTVLDPQDIATDNAKVQHKLAKARDAAGHVLEGCSLALGDLVAIVGIGHGALIALQVALQLVRTRNIVPAAFWAVQPPTVLPPEATGVADIEVDGPGWLVDCPLRYLVGEEAQCGSPWRWEVQTLGPFSTGIFTSPKELPGMVLREWSERLACWS